MKTLNDGVVVLGILLASCLRADANAADATPDMLGWVRAQNCLKCHAVDKTKQAPAYQVIAKRLTGDADAVQKIVAHLRSGRQVKTSDGYEIDHPIPDDRATETLERVATWILAR